MVSKTDRSLARGLRSTAGGLEETATFLRVCADGIDRFGSDEEALRETRTLVLHIAGLMRLLGKILDTRRENITRPP